MRKLFFLLLVFSLFDHVTGHATVNILVTTYDGFVIAADSRVTLSDEEKYRIASDSYQKVFRVGQLVGVSCSGAAFLYDASGQKRNIGSIIDSYKIKQAITDSTYVSPRAVADSLMKFVAGIYNKHLKNVKGGRLDLWVFGYDENKDRKSFEIIFPNVKRYSEDSVQILGNFKELNTSGYPASRVGGQTDVFTRLIKGYDPKLLGFSCYQKEKDKIDRLRYDIRYSIMSLQDAIDFAVFIVRATIEAQRFNQKAVMGVGGDIDIAIITPEGFRWIQRKQLHGEGNQ